MTLYPGLNFGYTRPASLQLAILALKDIPIRPGMAHGTNPLYERWFGFEEVEWMVAVTSWASVSLIFLECPIVQLYFDLFEIKTALWHPDRCFGCHGCGCHGPERPVSWPYRNHLAILTIVWWPFATGSSNSLKLYRNRENSITRRGTITQLTPFIYRPRQSHSATHHLPSSAFRIIIRCDLVSKRSFPLCWSAVSSIFYVCCNVPNALWAVEMVSGERESSKPCFSTQRLKSAT